MAKSLSGTNFIPGRPKKTRQGNGQHSKPRGTRKLMRGQGR
jgi:hypothetical protein